MTTEVATAAASGASATERFHSDKSPFAAVAGTPPERVDRLARRVLDAVYQTVRDEKVTYDEFNALKQGGHCHVTVGGITGSAAHVLVASVVEIQRLRPLLVIKILEQSSDQLIAWLAERKIDLMIGRFTTEDQRSQFHYEHLSAEPLHVVGGQHHPLRGATDLSLTELAHWPWILYPASTAVRKVSDDLFGGAGLALTAGVVETPSFLFALELMNTTHMMSLQPAALIQKYVDRGLLSRIPVELPDRMPSYGLTTRLGEPPTPSAQAFIDVLREAAGVAPDALGE